MIKSRLVIYHGGWGQPTVFGYGDIDTPKLTADRLEIGDRVFAGSRLQSTRSKLTPAPIPTF